jgi:hypothetical protein
MPHGECPCCTGLANKALVGSWASYRPQQVGFCVLALWSLSACQPARVPASPPGTAGSVWPCKAWCLLSMCLLSMAPEDQQASWGRQAGVQGLRMQEHTHTVLLVYTGSSTGRTVSAQAGAGCSPQNESTK